MVYNEIDLLKGFGMSEQGAQGLDWNKAKSTFGDFIKNINPEQFKLEVNELKDTGLFSSGLQNQFKDYLKNQQQVNDNFGGGVIDPGASDIPEITGGTTTGTTGTGTTGTTGGPIDTQNGQSEFASDFDRQRQENKEDLKKETERLKAEADKKREETKKQYLLGQQKFNQNKDYIENFDEVNNLYTSVVNDLVKSMGDSGVINENTYQEIANKYNLTLDEVKNAEKILDRAKYTEEGKKKTGQTEGEQSLADMEIARDRKVKDMQTSLDRTLQNYNWQIEDIEKQVTRNLSFMEASGAWSGAGRSSGFIEGMQNVKKDGETMINRLKTLAQQASEATEEEIARLEEDFTKAHTKAKEDLTEQLKQFTTNTMLALTEAQATYGMGSTKLQDLLKDIGVNLENQYYEQIERYYRIEDSINKKQLENLTYLQQIADQETAKIDTNYNNYLSNNGAILQNTSLTTVAQDLREGRINSQRANDLKQIMLSSIQSTLGAIAPVTTQDLKTIETLLMQGYTPAEIVAEMQSLEKFKPKEPIKKPIETLNLGDKTRVYYSDGSFEDFDTTKTTKSEGPIKMGEDSLYDPVNNKWITKPTTGGPTGTTTGYTGGDLTSIIDAKKGKDTNVGKWTNNPGNLMGDSQTQRDYATSLGAIGFYNSKNGRTYAVFPTKEEGDNAMRQDIQTKLNGGSAWATPNTTLQDFATGWTWGPNAGSKNIDATNNMIKFLKDNGINASANTTIGSLGIDALTGAVQYNEGTLGEEGQDWTGITTQGEDTTTYKTDAIQQYEKYLTSGDVGTDANRKAIEAEFGSVENFRKQAEAYNNSENGPRAKELEKIIKLKDTVSSILDKDKEGAIDDITGFIQTAATPWAKLKKEALLGDIQNFLDQQTLQNLIDTKAEGATFGALSNEELRMLQKASNKLASLAIYDKSGTIIKGFRGGTDNFKEKVKEIVEQYEEAISKKQKQMGKVDTTGTSTQVKSSSGNVYTIKPKK